MPIDTSLYGRIETPDAGNLLQAMAAGQQIRQQQSTNRLQALQAQQAQTTIGDDQRLREAIKNNTKDGAMDYLGVIGYLAQNGSGTQIPGVIKMQQDAIKQRADLMTSALRLQKDQSAQVMANPTLANANASLDRMESIFGPGSMSAERQALAAMGDDPQKIHAWAAGHGVDADKLLPQFTSRDIGGAVQAVSRNPITGQEQVIGTTNKTMTPGEVAAQQAASQARSLQQQQLEETRRHNKQTETLRSQSGGLTLLDDQGGMVGGSATLGKSGQALVDAIGSYQMSPKTALSRVQPGIRAQIIEAVRQQYPSFDETQYDAKQRAARDFTTGPLGNMMRSAATASDHLQQLDGLITALDNGNTPLLNKLANSYAVNTGSTAPTNFDAAKQVVGKEITKALVANGGSVGEREEFEHAMSNAKTPAQLRGLVAQYRDLFGAQQQNLMEQRRAAGLPDSTLPHYGQHGQQQAQKSQTTTAGRDLRAEYQDYKNARQQAYAQGNYDLVRRMDAEALKDGLIVRGK